MFNETIITHKAFLAAVLVAFSSVAIWSCSEISPPEGNQNENATTDNQNNNASTDDHNENTSPENDNGTGEEWGPMVNLQVTEDESVEAFDIIMAELQARGITATVIVDEYMSTEGCQSLQATDQEGHEIMVYGRPDEPGDEVITLATLSYEEQEEVISDAKSAIEDCLGKSVTGFRSYRFSQNEDTYEILSSLGITLNLSFVAHTTSSMAGHEDDEFPYLVEDYGFWAIPMHSVDTGTRWAAFCDMPFSTLEAADWEALLKSEFDAMDGEGRPLLVEVHPYFSAMDEGRFDALTSFLDYALGQGATFVTVAELVDWSGQDSL